MYETGYTYLIVIKKLNFRANLFGVRICKRFLFPNKIINPSNNVKLINIP